MFTKENVLHSIPSLTRISRKIRTQVGRFQGSVPKHRIDSKRKYAYYGSDYGGWHLCPNSLSTESIVYSVGVGDDISFDLELIERFQVNVFAFDPTPKAISWVEKQDLPDDFCFFPIGLAERNGTARFNPPKGDRAVSYSMDHQGTTTNAINLRVQTLHTIMRNLGHEHIDVLKMDIEGAEYGVIANLEQSNLDITQILVEFHYGSNSGGHSIKEVYNAVNILRRCGYDVFCISETGREYSFIRS